MAAFGKRISSRLFHRRNAQRLHYDTINTIHSTTTVLPGTALQHSLSLLSPVPIKSSTVLIVHSPPLQRKPPSEAVRYLAGYTVRYIVGTVAQKEPLLGDRNQNHVHLGQIRDHDLDHMDHDLDHIDYDLHHVDHDLDHIDHDLDHIDHDLDHIDYDLDHIDHDTHHIDHDLHHIYHDLDHLDHDLGHIDHALDHIDHDLDHIDHDLHHIDHDLHHTDHALDHIDHDLDHTDNDLDHIDHDLDNTDHDLDNLDPSQSFRYVLQDLYSTGPTHETSPDRAGCTAPTRQHDL